LSLLSVYVDYQLHLLFVFAATMLMVNKDYQRLAIDCRHYLLPVLFNFRVFVNSSSITAVTKTIA